MTFDFQALMHDATLQVRAGNLHAATQAIQAALTGRDPMQRPPSHAADANVIDVQAREVPGPASAPAAKRQASAPGADAMVTGTFGEGTARRDYKLYIPPGSAGQSLPLVLMLHGCTQDPDDFAAGTAMNTLAREQGFYVLYPAQSAQANPQRCWNWFKHTHQQRGRGEPATLAGMTRYVMGKHNVDASRVYVAGLSAGGAMAAILGNTYPELYAAVGVHSGLAAGAARDLPSALSAMRAGGPAPAARASGMPTIVFHGDADATVHPQNGKQVIMASVGSGARPEPSRVAAGRPTTRHVYRNEGGEVVGEYWEVGGAGHAWSGGSNRGTYTDARGPDASREMLRFFLEHPRPLT